MRAQLVINGVDFADWLAEDGIQYSSVDRLRRSVVTLDGTEHRAMINKLKMDVTLMDLPGDELAKVEAAFSYPNPNPALVNYTDKSGISHTGAPFYSSGVTAGARRVIGNTTYWSGITFSLEER